MFDLFFCSVGFGLVRLGVVRSCSVGFGLVWLGLVWFGCSVLSATNREYLRIRGGDEPFCTLLYHKAILARSGRVRGSTPWRRGQRPFLFWVGAELGPMAACVPRQQFSTLIPTMLGIL